MTGSWKAVGRVILVAVGAPLLVVAVGLWQWSRSGTDEVRLQRQQTELSRAVDWLNGGGSPERLEFREDGRVYVGPFAATKVRDALDSVHTGLAIARVRDALPPLVVGCGTLAALSAALALAVTALLARAGLRSRDRLVDGFALLRRTMPAVLGALVLLLAASAVIAASSELLALAENGDYSDGAIKILLIAVTVAGGSLWTAVRSMRQLRGTLVLFTPEPLPIMGRLVTAEQAPGLWQVVDALGTRLGALRPENVVVGLQDGFFVSSGPKVLQPGDIGIGGRTLYVPLPQLALVSPDQAAAIIGHELAHFSGADTEYSLRFLPIYAGVGRTLDAVLSGGRRKGRTVSLLIRPALALGGFVINSFHRAVRHWSRQREFDADAAGASFTSNDAMAGALLRITAVGQLVDATLGDAFRVPEDAPPDMVEAALARAASGLEDPSADLENSQPHPTDTHPATIQRLRALGRAPDPAAVAAAIAPPSAGSADLHQFFADPQPLCRQVTADFLVQARQSAIHARQLLQKAAGSIPQEERILRMDGRGIGLRLMGLGVVMAALAFLLWLGLPMMAGLLAGLAACVGLAIFAWGAWSMLRPPKPFLALRPEAMVLPELDRPIAWADVADVDMVADRGRVTTRVLVSSGVTMPGRLPGNGVRLTRRLQVDPAGRIVTFTSGMPRGMTPSAFAALVAQYRTADAARRKLSSAAPVPTKE